MLIKATPGTEPPDNKHARANDQIPNTDPDSVSENVQKPASLNSNTSEESEVQPTRLDPRMTHQTGGVPPGPLNEDMIGEMNEQWQTATNKKRNAKRTATQATKARREANMRNEQNKADSSQKKGNQGGNRRNRPPYNSPFPPNQQQNRKNNSGHSANLKNPPSQGKDGAKQS